MTTIPTVTPSIPGTSADVSIRPPWSRPAARNRPAGDAVRRSMRSFSALLSLVVVAMLLVAACGASGASQGPTASPTPAPTPTRGPVTTPEGALAAVIAVEPRLTGIAPKDPNLIGQAAWVEIAPASGVGAFLVNVRIGWGDCPAGCINEHTWTYAVQPDGSVRLESEAGDPVPPEAWPSPGGDGRTGILVTATASPTCPVERIPPDPSCAPRPVAGALAIIRDGSGNQVARITLDAQGVGFAEVPAGGYVVEPQPVQGLMGTPGAVSVTVIDGVGVPVALSYDTGIR